MRLSYLMLTMVLAAMIGCTEKAPKLPVQPGANDATQAPAVESEPVQLDAEESKAEKSGSDSAQPGESVSTDESGAAGAAQPDEAAAPALDPDLMATVRPLLAQMASDAGIERQPAAESLDQLGTAAAPCIVAALREGSDTEKQGAATYLIGRVSIADEEAAQALIEALAAPDERLRHNAFQAVEKLPKPQLVHALGPLATLAKNENETPAYRTRAVRAIAKLDAQAAAAADDLILLARNSATPEVQLAAVDAIGKVVPPEQSEAFFVDVLANSTQQDLRKLAAERLIQAASSTKAIVGLIGAFDDPHVDVRNQAVNSLLAIGKPAVPELIKTLDDPNIELRRRAIYTLGKLNRLAVDAVPALQKRAQEDVPEVRALAEASLKLIQAQ